MSDGTPKRIGDYEVLRLLGAGGMGRVYQVRSVITDRIEAMKVILPDLAGQEEVAARFLREIKVLASLKHPNIAALHTALTIDNQLVMIMEYVEGESLASRLRSGPIPVPDALTHIDQVLDALSYAHRQHVVHRDIKPANIMLTLDGTVKLMDFGIARSEGELTLLTAPGSTLGSLNYMSPEQVKGERTDERSDLYSLGISLYEIVTGQRPFHGDSSFSLMAAHLNQSPTPPVELQPGMPEGLNQIILTSIAKSPEQRFQSADAFRNAVRIVLQSLQDSRTVLQGSHTIAPVSFSQASTAPITTPSRTTLPPTASSLRPPPLPVSSTPVAPPPASRRSLYVGLGAVIVLMALVAAGFYMPGRKKASAAGDTDSVMQRPQVSAPETQPVSPVTSVNPAPEKQLVETGPPANITNSNSQKKLAARDDVSGPTPADTALEKQLVETGPPAKVTNSNSQKKLAARNDASGPTPADSARAAAEAAAAAKEAALDEIEQEINQLLSRSAAVNDSIGTLRQQQAAAGYGLRGDITARLSSMKVNLATAQNALARRDEVKAKKYSDLAASDVEALEKFLGR